MHFRNDINGLRAIAVIAVVLFHFNPSWLPGGFAGVDVFFVISGFLMTGIIFRGFERGDFSLLNFYVARANRIIPALAALCFVLLIFGWFYLPPLDYKALGSHIGSSMGFFSNIVYWRESGYFDAASQEKWLLHTWSLSAEWQFYIIYPLILTLLKRYCSYESIKMIILVGTVLGFLLSIFATYKFPNPAYYLLPTRAWEMMLGGIAFLYPLHLSSSKRKRLEWTGLLLIVGSYFLISKNNAWPGYLALFPVLGSFLVIQANNSESIFTGNRYFQAIGKWSYSIYLWHWPLVVAISYFAFSEKFIYLGLLLSLFFGFLSSRYIERINFRRSYSSFFGALNSKPMYLTVLMSGLGYGAFFTNGYDFHYSEKLIKINTESVNKNPYNCMSKNLFPCYIGNKDNVKAIIIGDSHADAVTTSLAASFDLQKEGIVAITKSSCPFILGAKSIVAGNECLIQNDKRRDFLNDNYRTIPVFWVARSAAYLMGQSNPKRVAYKTDLQPLFYFNEYHSELNDTLMNEFKSALHESINSINSERKVFVLYPTPEMRVNIPKTLSRQFLIEGNYDRISLDKALYFDRNQKVREVLHSLSTLENTYILDPLPYLCDEKYCHSEFKGRPIYFDGDHLSEFGNKLLTPLFKDALN